MIIRSSFFPTIEKRKKKFKPFPVIEGLELCGSTFEVLHDKLVVFTLFVKDVTHSKRVKDTPGDDLTADHPNARHGFFFFFDEQERVSGTERSKKDGRKKGDKHDQELLGDVEKVLKHGVDDDDHGEEISSAQVVEVLEDDHVAVQVVVLFCLRLDSRSIDERRVGLLNVWVFFLVVFSFGEGGMKEDHERGFSTMLKKAICMQWAKRLTYRTM